MLAFRRGHATRLQGRSREHATLGTTQSLIFPQFAARQAWEANGTLRACASSAPFSWSSRTTSRCPPWVARTKLVAPSCGARSCHVYLWIPSCAKITRNHVRAVVCTRRMQPRYITTTSNIDITQVGALYMHLACSNRYRPTLFHQFQQRLARARVLIALFFELYRQWKHSYNNILKHCLR